MKSSGEKVGKASFGENGGKFGKVAETEDSLRPGAPIHAVAKSVVPWRVPVLRERQCFERIRNSSQERLDRWGSLAGHLCLLHQVVHRYEAVSRCTAIHHDAPECE